MKLILYAVDDGDNVINKVLPVGYEIDIRMSNDVDVIMPRLILRDVVGVSYDDFNYAYIADLERYYFIDKVAKVNNRDSWLYLSCDVLETYKNGILNSHARVHRNLKTGDYVDANIDRENVQSVMLYNSGVTINPDDSSKIFVVIGD